jgi:hypothetical protein
MADRDERRPLPLLGEPRPPLSGERALDLRHAIRLPEEDIGVRDENPIVILGDGCEHLSKFPLSADVVA